MSRPFANNTPSQPVVIATWPIGRVACEAARPLLLQGAPALDAAEAGGTAVELDPTELYVGYGGLPNADGVLQLDACVMDGATHMSGAIMALEGFRGAASVARRVMERTPHAQLVGAGARRFALDQGFVEEETLTDQSRKRYREWLEKKNAPESDSHDTVSVCTLDTGGDLAAVCTTSGLEFKMPGRVGDSPLVGSGLYVENSVGAAAATGDGEDILRVCLSFQVVNFMEAGASPQEACERGIQRLLSRRPACMAAVIALSKTGETGSASTWTGFGTRERPWNYCVGDTSGIRMLEGPRLKG